MKIILNFLILLFFLPDVWAQQPVYTDSASITDGVNCTLNCKKRRWLVGGLSVAGYGGSLVMLNAAWYKNYARTSFHTFNDWGEWQQMDKVGHAWTAYQWSRVTTALWRWAGLSNSQSVWAGCASGFAYMTVIEVLDARCAEWGWSWGDVGANFTGPALFAAQQLAWKEQRIQFKFSVHRERYGGELETRANSLFGKTLPARLLKDYNTQTYWLSFHLKSFLPQLHFPSWLSVSVGTGADGMFGGYENKATGENGNVTFYRPDIKRYRQWYLSPDIDLTKIKTKSKVLKAAFGAFNILKVPAPAIEFSNGSVKGKLLLF